MERSADEFNLDEPISPDSIDYLRAQIQVRLAWFDRHAMYQKGVAVGTYAALFCTAIASFVLVWLQQGDGVLYSLSLALQVVTTVLVSVLMAFNPGARWEQYRLLRQQIRSKYLESELLASNEASEQLVRESLQAQLKDIGDLERSMWFANDLSVSPTRPLASLRHSARSETK